MDIDSEAGKREGGHDTFFFLIRRVTADGTARFMPMSIFYFLSELELLTRQAHGVAIKRSSILF